ncbi:hypothetical protein RhiirC2_798214 [Rhizophagus irregularis]|uniref:Uncharacterized protein n=1 Tax=Rhizophagus irregularis TaxID=588596 RepID=A0A2N1M6S1_9GLOM|nr:hypothetical protein RhiirC2_798214 [Rhizophagus irregularis]
MVEIGEIKSDYHMISPSDFIGLVSIIDLGISPFRLISPFILIFPFELFIGWISPFGLYWIDFY